MVIVGSGGAGLSAAIEAAEAGKISSILKMPTVEEHLISGGENECSWLGKRILNLLGDSVEGTMMKGGDNGDPNPVHLMAEKALESAEWLRWRTMLNSYQTTILTRWTPFKRALIPKGHTGAELVLQIKEKQKNFGRKNLLNVKAEN